MDLITGFLDTNVVKEMTLSTFLVALYCSLGAIGFGIDYGYWSGMLAMPQFLNDFGVYNPKTNSFDLPSTWQSAGSGPPIAGLAVGAVIAGMVGNHLGRLKTFRLSSVISIAGILIQCTSVGSYWQIMIGRIINSLALGILANTVPAYLAEVSPLSIRGTLVNCYQFSISIGAILVNTANWGMYQRTDQWAYRLVLILQLTVPIIFVIGSFFVPESPRWLIGKNRCADAGNSLRTLRTDTSPEVVDQEIQLIMAAEEENKSQFDRSWVECFRGPNLRRTLIATGVQCLQQAQGNSFMATYSVVYLKLLGIQDIYKIQILMSLTMALACGFAFYIPDRFGRRWLLIVTAVTLWVSMYIISAIQASGFSSHASGQKTAAAFIFIWQAAMSIGWSSCVWIVTAEVPTLQLREKTITIATFIGFCVSILVTFVTPFIQDPGYGNLGARIGFLYGGFSFAAAIWAFLFFPETGFRSLEELDELFQEKVSVWRFRTYQTSGYGAQLAKVEDPTHRRDAVSDKTTAGHEENLS